MFDVCKAMELRSFGESEVIVNIGMECLSHTVNVGCIALVVKGRSFKHFM